MSSLVSPTAGVTLGTLEAKRVYSRAGKEETGSKIKGDEMQLSGNREGEKSPAHC